MTYSLVRRKTFFPSHTQVTYYNQSNVKRKDNQFKSVTCSDGYRYKVNLLTGERRTYTCAEADEILRVSTSRTHRLFSMLLECNDFDWFCTLTFDNERCDRNNPKEVYNLYSKFIRSLSRKFPNLRYVCVPENHKNNLYEIVKQYGTRILINNDILEGNECVHFHLLIGGVKPSELGLVNSGKVCCSWATKNKCCNKEYFDRTKEGKALTLTDGLTIYNISKFKYGLTTATRIASKQACRFYVEKYIDKNMGSSTETFKKRFFYSSNLNVPPVVKDIIKSELEEPEDLSKYSELEFDEMVRASQQFVDDFRVHYSDKYNVLNMNLSNKLAEDIENAPEGCELIKLEEGEDPFLQQIF